MKPKSSLSIFIQKKFEFHWTVRKNSLLFPQYFNFQIYEEAFSKIQAATGISDIDQLVETFISAEDKNFSLFNYANEVGAQFPINFFQQ